MSWQRPAKRILFIFLTLLLVFGGGELLLRLSGLAVNSGDIARADQWLYHPLAREDIGWDEYITLGARVYPPSPENYNISRPLPPKPAGVIRVFCLGDSSTIGAEVQPEQAYPQVLQGLVDRCYPSRKIEIWNFGRHGYTSYQGRVLMESIWDTARPDVLVFYFGTNDMSIAPLRADKDWADMPLWALQTHRALYRHSALYRLLRNVNLSYLRLRVKRVFDKDAQQAARMRVSQEDFFANREALRQRVTAGSGRLITIVSANLAGDRIIPTTAYLDYTPTADDIDIASLFSPMQAAGQKPFADMVHPSALGHQLLAQALLAKLAEIWGAQACEPPQSSASVSQK